MRSLNHCPRAIHTVQAMQLTPSDVSFSKLAAEHACDRTSGYVGLLQLFAVAPCLLLLDPLQAHPTHGLGNNVTTFSRALKPMIYASCSVQLARVDAQTFPR